jgi:hypothetical protein
MIHVIVLVEIVEPAHFFVLGEETTAGMKADEPRASGNQNLV